MEMEPFTGIKEHEARGITGILTDIDDTITLGGKLTEEGFRALWKAFDSGLMVIPVTGRPAGWCDMIARMWPVSGVIGENGAFYFYMKSGKLCRHFVQDREKRRENLLRLRRIEEEILARVPGVRVSADQPYRESDLAIDFREDVPDRGIEVASQIKRIFEKHGARAKISSIHVNGWYGDYDKLSTTKLFFRDVLKVNLEEKKGNFLFTGDSPNDGPMFEFFDFSCVIGDIEQYGNQFVKHV